MSTTALHPRLQGYLDAVADTCTADGLQLTALVVFGSAVTGGYRESASDVDLIVVLADGARREDRRRARAHVQRLELLHGLRDEDPALSEGRLAAWVRSITANVRSFFVCTRADLLSGDVARILDIPRTQAVFVDRVVVPSIVGSGLTVWGEDLLPHVPLPAIRRGDVFKAFFGFWNQALLSAAAYPVVPAATGFAMATLKRSVHNCYFCYHLRPAALEDEVAFLRQRVGGGSTRHVNHTDRTLDELMELRHEPRRSFGFVLRCLPVLVRLHLRTAVDNRFPRQPPARCLE
ncbi:hypothetical protein BH23GEM9_BH23GEM9_20430 [soil metagenome]